MLKSIGFVEDAHVISDPPGGLSLAVGRFKLEASHVINRWFQPVVVLSGCFASPREIAELECEMPRTLESREQGFAWIAWCLDRQAGSFAEPFGQLKWIRAGRRSFHLLPWERQRAAYESQPRCRILREWARLLLRRMGEVTPQVRRTALIDFTFDGEVLSFRVGNTLIESAAEGTRWASRYALTAGSLAQLPRRLPSSDYVELSVWALALVIGNTRYFWRERGGQCRRS
jgi:hypothetical protein